jgi:hypothetical protein
VEGHRRLPPVDVGQHGDGARVADGEDVPDEAAGGVDEEAATPADGPRVRREHVPQRLGPAGEAGERRDDPDREQQRVRADDDGQDPSPVEERPDEQDRRDEDRRGGEQPYPRPGRGPVPRDVPPVDGVAHFVVTA